MLPLLLLLLVDLFFSDPCGILPWEMTASVPWESPPGTPLPATPSPASVPFLQFVCVCVCVCVCVRACVRACVSVCVCV